MKSSKRFLSLLLACILALSLLPTAAFAAEGDFVIENGVLTKYRGSGGDVTIPDGVTSIGEKAFYECSKLTSVTIPNGVTSIGAEAFRDCYSLTSVTIPSGVTSIGERAFEWCKSLTSVTIPSSVTSIGASAFSDCTSLTSVTIPDGVTSIGSKVFYKCDKLTSVSIPNSVTSIGDQAFFDCDSLTSVSIPNSVTSIGDGAFGECSKLTEIQVDRGNPAYSSLDGILFNKNQTMLCCYPGGLRGDYVIPDGVTSILSSAFYTCTGLTNVTIPEGVTSIGACAFYRCTNLMSVTIPNSVTSIWNSAFSLCKALTDVYYDGSEEQWQTINIGRDNERLLNATIHYAAAPAPASDIPLALTGVCRKSANTATVSVVTTQPVTLSNYDVTLTWNKSLFTLTNVTNGQPSLMTIFQKNTTTGRTSAASGNNVTIPAGATLATYTLSAKTTPKKGDVYDFSLLVRDVADENGDPLPWKGLTVDGKIPVALPLSFDCRAPQAFTLNDTTPAAGDFTVESATPCIVLYSNGSGYQKMEASLVSGNTYSFTVPDDYDDSTKIVVAVKGDFSADGEITSTDANQVLRCSAGNRSYDQVTMLICDINGDGELTSTDANQLLRVSTELRTLAW